MSVCNVYPHPVPLLPSFFFVFFLFFCFFFVKLFLGAFPRLRPRLLTCSRLPQVAQLFFFSNIFLFISFFIPLPSYQELGWFRCFFLKKKKKKFWCRGCFDVSEETELLLIFFLLLSLKLDWFFFVSFDFFLTPTGFPVGWKVEWRKLEWRWLEKKTQRKRKRNSIILFFSSFFLNKTHFLPPPFLFFCLQRTTMTSTSSTMMMMMMMMMMLMMTLMMLTTTRWWRWGWRVALVTCCSFFVSRYGSVTVLFFPFSFDVTGFYLVFGRVRHLVSDPLRFAMSSMAFEFESSFLFSRKSLSIVYWVLPGFESLTFTDSSLLFVCFYPVPRRSTISFEKKIRKDTRFILILALIWSECIASLPGFT